MDAGAVTVKARIALESSGESVCPWTECRVEPGLRWSVEFSVPAGGLYRVETYMEYEGWDGLSSTRGDMVHHIGVGDVFVAAGQSNAAGRAKNPVEDPPELEPLRPLRRRSRSSLCRRHRGASRALFIPWGRPPARSIWATLRTTIRDTAPGSTLPGS